MSNIEKYKSPAALGPAVNQFDSDLRMAEALCMSELMPEAYRGSIPNTLIAIDVARRIGASVLQVAQNLHIIHGKPSWSASFLIGTVNSSGKFTRLKPQYVGEGSSRGCRMIATDLADGMQCIGTLFTYAMAVEEGYVSRKGSKWKTFGEQMLAYRAAALWVRVFAPEVSLGMQTSDEADDIGAFAVGGTAAPVAARRGTRASAAVTASSDRLTQRLEASTVTVSQESLGDQLARAAADRAAIASRMQAEARAQSIASAAQPTNGAVEWGQQSAALDAALEREPGGDDEGLHSPD